MCGKFLIVLFFISLSVKGEKKKEETETLLLIALLLFNELYVSASRPPSELVLSVKGKGRERLVIALQGLTMHSIFVNLTFIS